MRLLTPAILTSIVLSGCLSVSGLRNDAQSIDTTYIGRQVDDEPLDTAYEVQLDLTEQAASVYVEEVTTCRRRVVDQYEDVAVTTRELPWWHWLVFGGGLGLAGGGGAAWGIGASQYASIDSEPVGPPSVETEFDDGKALEVTGITLTSIGGLVLLSEAIDLYWARDSSTRPQTREELASDTEIECDRQPASGDAVVRYSTDIAQGELVKGRLEINVQEFRGDYLDSPERNEHTGDGWLDIEIDGQDIARIDVEPFVPGDWKEARNEFIIERAVAAREAADTSLDDGNLWAAEKAMYGCEEVAVSHPACRELRGYVLCRMSAQTDDAFEAHALLERAKEFTDFELAAECIAAEASTIERAYEKAIERAEAEREERLAQELEAEQEREESEGWFGTVFAQDNWSYYQNNIYVVAEFLYFDALTRDPDLEEWDEPAAEQALIDSTLAVCEWKARKIEAYGEKGLRIALDHYCDLRGDGLVWVEMDSRRYEIATKTCRKKLKRVCQ